METDPSAQLIALRALVDALRADRDQMEAGRLAALIEVARLQETVVALEARLIALEPPGRQRGLASLITPPEQQRGA